jgi:AraC-like DNA-binding protein
MKSKLCLKLFITAILVLTLHSCNREGSVDKFVINCNDTISLGNARDDSVRHQKIAEVMRRPNPFVNFVGKPYGSYHYALRDTLRVRYDLNDGRLVERTVEQMRSLPDALHDHQWQMEADYMAANYIHDYQGGSEERLILQLHRLLDESRRHGNKVWEVRIIRRLFDLSLGNDIVGGISYARQLEKAMDMVTTQAYPDLVDCKFRLGMMYLAFKDYYRAEKYFKRVVSYPVNNEIQPIFIHSRNNLGIICRDFYRDYDASDRWFSSIYAFRRRYGIKELPEQWNAIVLGNLGKNQLLRGNYVKAEPMMLASFNAMYKAADYHYAYYMATYLVDAYCRKGDLANARRFLVIADSCERKSQSLVKIKTRDYYMAASKYCAATHNAVLAADYVDSAFMADVDYERHYDRSRFLQTEQKQGQMELQMKNQEAKANYRRFVNIGLTSCVVLVLFAVSLLLYIRERRAYKLLVKKTKEWANRRQPYDQPQQDGGPCVEEGTNVQSILDYMESSKCYLSSDLSLDGLARDLGINRTYLSNTVNELDENFKSFVNKYRIKHAIQIFDENPEANIEDVALQVGFNNRKTFYNSFIAITGLSPAQFRKNKINIPWTGPVKGASSAANR